MVSTITTAGRISGFNSSVRWLYGGTSPGTHGGRLKRRRPTDDHEVDETDVEKGLSDGFPPLHHVDSGGFMPETLPPYDPEGRSPMYELHGGSTQPGREHPPPSDRSLGTRLLMTTSGLQAALNDRSLKSLKYCLSWLRWTSHNVGNMTTSLRSAIQEYHESGQQPPKQPTADADGDMRMSSEFSDRSKTVQSMRTLKSGIVDGINHVIDIVSTYAGGALPENARNLVQRQILSLPSRFNLASPRNNMEGPPDQSTSAQGVEAQSSPTRDIQTQTPPGSTNSVVRPSSEPEKCSPENEAKSAKRVVIFAEQALDMITQVSGVIAGTVQSAEDWLDRFDRRPRSAGDGEDRQLQRKPSLYKSGTPQIVLNEKETFRLVDEKEG